MHPACGKRALLTTDEWRRLLCTPVVRNMKSEEDSYSNVVILIMASFRDPSAILPSIWGMSVTLSLSVGEWLTRASERAKHTQEEKRMKGERGKYTSVDSKDKEWTVRLFGRFVLYVKRRVNQKVNRLVSRRFFCFPFQLREKTRRALKWIPNCFDHKCSKGATVRQTERESSS